jgi:tRNA G18 (ribose-2'-O)-methylase SpoU
VVPVVQGSLHRVVKVLKDEGFTIIGVDGCAKKDIYSERLTGAVAFILGGEHHGLAEQILDKCDSVVRIPMSQQASSLNVGVAAAVVLYERVRQQGKI